MPSVLAGISGLELVAKTVVDGFVSGLHRSPDFGFSQEFAEYCAYTPGDDLRHIDWNVYARNERLVLKRFRGETNSLLTILLDASNSMQFGSHSDRRFRQFCGFAPWGNLQVGQFYLPFTLENRISDNTTPFLERSLAVRNIGAPLQRDIGAMLWGESPDRLLYYAVAIVNGDGPEPDERRRPLRLGGPRARATLRGGASSALTRFAQIGFSAKAGLARSEDRRLRSAFADDPGRLSVLEADVQGLPRPNDSHHPRSRPMGARRRHVRANRATST